MMLTGKNLVACEPAESAGDSFTGGGALAAFDEASGAIVEQAFDAADAAASAYRRCPAEQRAEFLDRIADALDGMPDLLDAAHVETALPVERLTGERGRTSGQLRLFANVVRDGSWVDARIDRALPDRKPLPRPD